MILHSAYSPFSKGQYVTEKVPPVDRLTRLPSEFLQKTVVSNTGTTVDIVFDSKNPTDNIQNQKKPASEQSLTKEFKTAAGLSEAQASSLEKAKQDLQIQKVVAQLQTTDTEVRTHEQAHMGAGSGLITRGASYTYEKGPDGRQYAVGGEVGIDTSPVQDDPEATMQKMQQVKAAAMAPARPSGQDLAVATAASALEAQALKELAESRLNEQTETQKESAPQKLTTASLQELYTEFNTDQRKVTQSEISQELFSLELNIQTNIISRYVS
ncbi:MAG: putative metalloprotease CJM1_0395 family protein [Treponemataceae bacterium]